MIAHQSNSSKSNNIDPTVINEALIDKAIKEYYQENKIQTNQERLRMQYQTNLSLSFSNLSFNCIQQIENIDKLTQITDLSLYANQITKVENLENLILLNVFSIGNNKLENYDTITSMFGKGSKLKNLQVLNVAGNPFTTKEADYKENLIFSLKKLQYLDYVYIDEATREEIKGKEKFQQDDTNDQLDKEDQMEKDRLVDEKKKFDSGMNLVEDLQKQLVADSDIQRIKILKGIDDEIGKFQEKVMNVVEQLQEGKRDEGLKEGVIDINQQKLKDIMKFEAAVLFREKQSEEETISLLRKLEHDKKNAFKAHESQAPGWREGLENLEQNVQKVKDDLLYVEVILMEDIENSITDFNAKLSKYTSEMEKKNNESLDTDLKKEIDTFHSKIQEIAKNELDKFEKGQETEQPTPSEYTPDQEQLLESKEALNATINNIKDALISKAEKKCADILKKIQNDLQTFLKETRERQYERNRKNINNIINDITKYSELIKERQQNAETDSDKD